MGTELYTIDKTPSTDLEKFQALRIDALEKEIIRYKDFLERIKSEFEEYKINGIEVIGFELVENKD